MNITSTRITVIGTGYLGATHAACMAELGFEVIGLDIDPVKIATLNAGTVPFYEPGLNELVGRHVESGRLRFTTDSAEAARFGQVHFIGVGTPQQPGRLAADMSYVEAAIDNMAPHLSDGDIVVGKSTVPVGTAARMQHRLNARLPAGVSVDLVWNPEFLREGFAVEDTLRPDRIVLGTSNQRSIAILKHVYAQPIAQGSALLVTDRQTAELVKTAANAFLATKISFINAMAELCEAADADVADLADAIGHDARIGRRFLNAGVGFGGGCLPKDIRAFRARADELGLEDTLSFLTDIDRINTRRRQRVIDLAERALGGRVSGRRVAVLGLAFKPNSDDLRDSPALDVARQLHRRGADVRAYDPMATEMAAIRHPGLDYRYSLTDAVRAAELVLVLTEWNEFVRMDPAAMGELADQAIIIDARNCLDADAWKQAGWNYAGLGRQHPVYEDPQLVHVPDTIAELTGDLELVEN